MARDFRASRFRGSRQLSEDVNPSAYIVNLADCMLVLALGFMVALISYWNVNIAAVTDLDDSTMQEVDPSTLPAEMIENGSYFVEAGRVYKDPNTGELFMLEESGEAGAAASGPAASGADAGSAGEAGESVDANPADVAAARAAGAD